jgi:hypothetical protein
MIEVRAPLQGTVVGLPAVGDPVRPGAWITSVLIPAAAADAPASKRRYVDTW